MLIISVFIQQINLDSYITCHIISLSIRESTYKITI